MIILRKRRRVHSTIIYVLLNSQNTACATTGFWLLFTNIIPLLLRNTPPAEPRYPGFLFSHANSNQEDGAHTTLPLLIFVVVLAYYRSPLTDAVAQHSCARRYNLFSVSLLPSLAFDFRLWGTRRRLTCRISQICIFHWWSDAAFRRRLPTKTRRNQKEGAKERKQDNRTHFRILLHPSFVVFFFLLILFIMCIPCCFTISTAEVGIVEKWGKFSRLVQPGLGFVICPMEQLVGRLSFRVQQLDVRVETKTADNVFLVAVVSVQYQVLRESVFEAYYALTNPAQQITYVTWC